MTRPGGRLVVFRAAVRPEAVGLALVAAIACLTVASTIGGAFLWMFHWPKGSAGYEAVRLFWLDTEFNLPTLFEFAEMAAASFLLFTLADRTTSILPSDRRRWQVLGSVFILLALDEILRLHETVEELGVLRVSADWIIPPAFLYAPLLLALAIWFAPLLLRLDRRTRLLIISSGLMFVAGAAGVELISLEHAATHGKTGPVYAALATVEEVLEMLGIALFIYTLLDYMARLDVEPAPPA